MKKIQHMKIMRDFRAIIFANIFCGDNPVKILTKHFWSLSLCKRGEELGICP